MGWNTLWSGPPTNTVPSSIYSHSHLLLMYKNTVGVLLQLLLAKKLLMLELLGIKSLLMLLLIRWLVGWAVPSTWWGLLENVGMGNGRLESGLYTREGLGCGLCKNWGCHIGLCRKFGRLCEALLRLLVLSGWQLLGMRLLRL